MMMNPFMMGGPNLSLGQKPEEKWSKKTKFDKFEYLASRVANNLKSCAWLWVPLVTTLGITTGLKFRNENGEFNSGEVVETIFIRLLMMLPTPSLAPFQGDEELPPQ
jgi:hypothetical protein